MKRTTNLYSLTILALIVIMSMMACKKKKNNTLFPDDDNNGGGGGGNSLTTIVDLPFADDFNTVITEYSIPSRWIEGLASSKIDRGWGWRPSFGSNSSGAMAASSFGGTSGSDNTYLITGPFNFNTYPIVNLGFDVKKVFTGPGLVRVVYSTNYSGTGNPEAAGISWTEITSITSQIPTTENATFTNIVSDLSGINESKVYLAFRFYEGTSAASTSWNLDNFVLSNSTLTVSNCGSEAGTTTTNGYATISTKTLPFSDSFEYGCRLVDFSIPSNVWAEAVVTGNITNRGWSYRGTLGINNGGGMTASSFVSATATSTPTTDNSYLVVGPFTVSSIATRNLSLKYKRTNTNPGLLKIVYSTNYSGSGNPEASGVSWSEISDLSTTATTTFATHSVNIGSGGTNVTGTAVYFGLQFIDGTITSSQSYQINDFSIGN